MKKILVIWMALYSRTINAQETRQLAVDKPQAIADLRTLSGSAWGNAHWYVQNADIVTADFKKPGPGTNGDSSLIYPTGLKEKTNQLHPQIGDADFKQHLQEIKPTELEKRRGNGLISFVWYTVELTIPEMIGKLDTRGTTAVFEIVMDDYSEIWVNGKQKGEREFGLSGEGAISGYNARNRVILSDNAQPGEKYSISILGINGTLGMIPDNYIWVRNAVVDFYNDLPVNQGWKNTGKIYTIDKKLDKIIPGGTLIEKVADGFSFTEGPV